MRNLSQENIDGFSENGPLPNLFAVFEFDEETIGMWTGLGQMTWGGVTFHGGGNLIGVTPIQETQELQAKGTVLSLNGISQDNIALTLNEPLKNRPMRLYLGLTTDGAITNPDTGEPITNPDTGMILKNPDAAGLIDEPARIFSGLMDTVEFAIEDTTADIRLNVEPILLIGQRPKLRRYTDEDQRKFHPTDTGLSRINALQDKEVVW